MMDHDARCSAHEARIAEIDKHVAVLVESLKPINSDLDMVVERTQIAVNEYNAQGKLILALTKDVEAARREIASLRDEQRRDTTLIRDDISAIKRALAEKVTPLDQFLVVRNQLWGGIGVIVLSFLSALTWLVYRGGRP
jgi:hypothetical protein